MSSKTTGRIVLSSNIDQNLSLAAKVYEKHQAEGKNSLLLQLDDMDWDATGPKIAACLQFHQEAVSFTKKTEELFRSRDLMLPEINEILRASKAILKGKFIKNPKKLGEWGFVVDDTPKPRPAKKPKDPITS